MLPCSLEVLEYTTFRQLCDNMLLMVRILIICCIVSIIEIFINIFYNRFLWTFDFSPLTLYFIISIIGDVDHSAVRWIDGMCYTYYLTPKNCLIRS